MMLISKVSTLEKDAAEKRLPRFSAPASFLDRKGYYKFYLLVVFGVLAMQAPVTQGQDFFSYQGGCRRCVENYDPNTNYFPVQVAPDNSLDYSVVYTNSYKVINNNRATTGVSTFYAYLCGTPIPVVPPGAIAVEIPIRNYALVSTTHAGYFEQIAQLGTFAAFGSPSFYFNANGLPCSTALAGSASVAFNPSTAFPEPQSVTDGFFEDLTSPGGAHPERDLDAIFVDNYNANQQQYSRIPESKRDNAVVIEISESLSDNPIQHLEWVEYVSLFFNKEPLASSIVTSAKNLYNCHKNGVSGGAPTVLYLTSCPNAAFGITNYNVGAASGEFYNTLIADAGGNKLNGNQVGGAVDGTVSVAAFENHFSNAANAVDIVIAAVSISNCNLNGAAFNNAKTFGLESSNVWFGARFLIPDRTLFEFIGMIKNPTAIPNPKRIMFKRADATVNDFTTVSGPACNFDISFDLSTLSVPCGGNPIPSPTNIIANALTCGTASGSVSFALAAMCLWAMAALI